MDIPKKKRRTEEEVDLKKCIICQTDTKEPLVKSISIDAYKNILFYVISRGIYGESEFVASSRHLEEVSEDDLKQSGASVHASCRKATVNSENSEEPKTGLRQLSLLKTSLFFLELLAGPNLN